MQSRSVDPDWQRLGHSGHHYGPKVCKGWCAGSSTGSCMMCVACCCRRAASELPIRVAKRATQVTAVAHCAALARSRGTSRPRPHAERWLPSKMSADACIFHEERGSCRPAPGGDGDWMKTFFELTTNVFYRFIDWRESTCRRSGRRTKAAEGVERRAGDLPWLIALSPLQKCSPCIEKNVYPAG